MDDEGLGVCVCVSDGNISSNGIHRRAFVTSSDFDMIDHSMASEVHPKEQCEK